MQNTKLTLLGVVVAAVGALSGSPQASGASNGPSGVVLRGTIKDAAGKPLEGIVVTARADGKTYATSAFTDARGMYDFPAMEQGSYKVWAQATGFERADAAVKLGKSGQVRQNFALKDFKDIGRQLTGSEWIANLPDETKNDQRMKLIVRNNCSGCHTPGFILQNRFDEDGWRKIVTTMERLSIMGLQPNMEAAPEPLIRQYREELVAYLTKARGPAPRELKAFPRPSGESTRVVINEYDYTSGLNGEYVVSDGSNWAEGHPSNYQARGTHDVEPDPFGYVWVADSQVDKLRTIARLDPRTGEVRNYAVPGRNGMARDSHGLVVDQKGHVWLNAGGALLGVDPQADEVTVYQPPAGVGAVGGTLDVDNNGIIWATSNQGAVTFDPKTGKFTDFRSKGTLGYLGTTYGLAVDSLGNGWWTQMAIDRLMVGNPRTGEVTQIQLPPVTKWDDVFTERDHKLFKEIGSWWNTAVPMAQGPRRLGAERNGNYVWIANSWGNNLGRIDIRTHEVKFFDYPNQKAFPGIYDIAIDKNGILWVNMMNSDHFVRFDPKTEQWTEYRMPSLGTEARFVAVDNTKDPVEVWMPSYRLNKIMRLQFRDAPKGRQLQAKQ